MNNKILWPFKVIYFLSIIMKKIKVCLFLPLLNKIINYGTTSILYYFDESIPNLTNFFIIQR